MTTPPSKEALRITKEWAQARIQSVYYSVDNAPIKNLKIKLYNSKWVFSGLMNGKKFIANIELSRNESDGFIVEIKAEEGIEMEKLKAAISDLLDE